MSHCGTAHRAASLRPRPCANCRSIPHRAASWTAALDNVVITGGSGAIGLQYARYCIEHGARRIILLSRNGPRSGWCRRARRRPRRRGACPACDITDPADVVGRRRRIRRCRCVVADPRRRHRQVRARMLDLTGADVARCVRGQGPGLARDGRCVAAAAGLPDPGLLVGVRGVGRPWARRRTRRPTGCSTCWPLSCGPTGLDCTAIRWGLWQGAGVVGGRGDRPHRALRSGRDGS